MVNYYKLGSGKRLNEIVFAGSHDAGISEGGFNAKTQSLDIYDQAMAGVRIFDLRIAAAAAGSVGGQKQVELKAYHGDKKLYNGFIRKDETKSRVVAGLHGGQPQQLVRSKMARGGVFGASLQAMLQDARSFVEFAMPEEFLILKFDHCLNNSLIADACVSIVDDKLYTGSGNLNLKTLEDVKGKVIVTFAPDGIRDINGGYGPADGIWGIQSLKSKKGPAKAYNPDFDGIQYYGKGGTSVMKPDLWGKSKSFSNKVSENIKKQTKLMKEGMHTDPAVMGMMYWTTTGIGQNILERNDFMWGDLNKAKMKNLWNGGLWDSIYDRLTNDVDPKSYSSGGIIKTFMPNFVMMDFASSDKCQVIYELNTTAATMLTTYVKDWVD